STRHHHAKDAAFFHRSGDRLGDSTACFDLFARLPDLLCKPDSGVQNRRIFCPCFAREVGHRFILLLAEANCWSASRLLVTLVTRSLLIIATPSHAAITQSRSLPDLARGAGYSVVRSGSPG